MVQKVRGGAPGPSFFLAPGRYHYSLGMIFPLGIYGTADLIRKRISLSFQRFFLACKLH